MEKYTVSGYVFDTREEAMAAKKELSLVQSICQKMGGEGANSLDISNPKHAKAVYDRIVARDMFHTVVGQEFLESLRMNFEGADSSEGKKDKSGEDLKSEPDVNVSAAEEPVSEEPVIKVPMAEESLEEELIIREPVIEKSEETDKAFVIESPIADEPVESNPVSDEDVRLLKETVAAEPEEEPEAQTAEEEEDDEEMLDFSRRIEMETQKTMHRMKAKSLEEETPAEEVLQKIKEESLPAQNKMDMNLDIFELGEEKTSASSITKQMTFSFDEEEAETKKEASEESSETEVKIEEEDFHSMWKKKALDVLYDTEEEEPAASGELKDDYEAVEEEEEEEEDVPESRHYRGLFFNSFVLNIILLAGLITLCLYAFGSDNANMLNYERVLDNQYQEKLNELQSEYESMKEALTVQNQDAAE